MSRSAPQPRRSTAARVPRPRRPGFLRAAAALTGALASCGAGAGVGAVALADLELEQLRDVVVSSVSRTPEALDGLPASVYVIGADAIRRSGATTLPEALRLAPTLTVARADANQYAINARGHLNVLANRMLVLIDGRNVYTPLFSGVFWEAQDVLLEDVDRIEVVTGPGTALWGSNAVDALVHVITKPAAATAGGAAFVHGGNRDRSAALRWGGRTGDAAWRGHFKAWGRDETRRADGSPVFDASRGVQAGWRADWAAAAGGRLTLQGDAYRARADQPGAAGRAGEPREWGGANVAAHWERSAGRVQDSVHLVLDHTERVHPGSFADRLDTLDLAAQRVWAVGTHRVALGGGWRQSRDRAAGSAGLAFLPGTRDLGWHRLFVQDQVRLAPDWSATLAASFEHNPYTGVETLPSLRLAWNAGGGVAWAALSRAVRAPSRVDREFFAPADPPHALAGGPDFRSERSDVAEIGWRAQAGATLAYAVTLYHAQQRRLRSLAPTPQGAQWRNDIEGRDAGVEAWAQWRPLPAWRLDGGFVAREQALRVAPGAVDAGGLAALGNSPRHQASLRSALDLPRGWRWDADLRRVGALPDPAVTAYTAFGTRLAWTPRPGWEWSVGVDNAFDPQHPEWGVATNRVEVERAVFLRLRVGP